MAPTRPGRPTCPAPPTEAWASNISTICSGPVDSCGRGMRRDHFKNHDWELAGMLLELGDMMVTCVCFLIDLFLLLGVYLCILYMHIYARDDCRLEFRVSLWSPRLEVYHGAQVQGRVKGAMRVDTCAFHVFICEEDMLCSCMEILPLVRHSNSTACSSRPREGSSTLNSRHFSGNDRLKPYETEVCLFNRPHENI